MHHIVFHSLKYRFFINFCPYPMLLSRICGIDLCSAIAVEWMFVLLETPQQDRLFVHYKIVCGRSGRTCRNDCGVKIQTTSVISWPPNIIMLVMLRQHVNKPEMVLQVEENTTWNVSGDLIRSAFEVQRTKEGLIWLNWKETFRWLLVSMSYLIHSAAIA